MDNELTVKEETALAQQVEAPLGFGEDDADDLLIPRIKVAQALSPEVKDGSVKIGDIFNSLTTDVLTDKVFIPVCKFNNNVYWRDRADGGGIICRSADGKTGQYEDGRILHCAQCRKCEFDNTKKGRDAIPVCTKYINFLGFFEDDFMPIILSFSKTNMAEGKKMYSMAKVTRQHIWNFGYTLASVERHKNGNDWFVIDPRNAGQTSEETRMIAKELFDQFAASVTSIRYDMDEQKGTVEGTVEIVDDDKSEF